MDASSDGLRADFVTFRELGFSPHVDALIHKARDASQFPEKRSNHGTPSRLELGVYQVGVSQNAGTPCFSRYQKVTMRQPTIARGTLF